MNKIIKVAEGLNLNKKETKRSNFAKIESERIGIALVVRGDVPHFKLKAEYSFENKVSPTEWISEDFDGSEFIIEEDVHKGKFLRTITPQKANYIRLVFEGYADNSSDTEIDAYIITGGR